ncbi:hypothetical protein EOM09_08275, partial [bacterium]|nr:hypothetical protein [bacterium]
MKKFIKGKISKILYLGNNGYTVGIFKVMETEDENLAEYLKKTITFTYTGVPLNKDLTYKFSGELIEHPRFGMQYRVTAAEIVEPDDLEGIILYLSSGIFKGIGVKTATNIVNTLGENSISLIREDKNVLLRVKGMSLKKINSLYQELNDYYEDQKLIIDLNSIGFSTKESLNIVNNHKSEMNYMLSENIYILTGEVDFLKLDNIYLKTHEETTPVRIKEIIKYIIKKISYETGDTLIEKENIYLNMIKYFSDKFELNSFLYYLGELNKEGTVIIKNDLITLRDFYDTEKYISSRIKFLNRIKSPFNLKSINEHLKLVEEERNIHFDSIQKEAITKALQNNFFVITGGPGTGKTTIIRA